MFRLNLGLLGLASLDISLIATGADFANGLYSQPIGVPVTEADFFAQFTAASTSERTYFDNTNTLKNDLIANQPRFSFEYGKRWLVLESASTNNVRNNSGTGAVAGSPGTFPTNWLPASDVGLTWNIVEKGTELGMPYVDFRLSGTASGAGDSTIRLGLITHTVSVNNDKISCSFYATRVGGLISNVSDLSCVLSSYNSSSVFLSSAVGVSVPVSSLATDTLTLHRYKGGKVVTDATSQYIVPYLTVSTIAAGDVDITIRIGGTQLEKQGFTSHVILTTTVGVTRAVESFRLPTYIETLLQGGQGTAIVNGRFDSFVSGINRRLIGGASGVYLGLHSSGDDVISTSNASNVLTGALIGGSAAECSVGGNWNSLGRSICGNGGVIASDAFGHGSYATAYLGRDAGSATVSVFGNGLYSSARFWQTKDNNMLQLETTVEVAALRLAPPTLTNPTVWNPTTDGFPEGLNLPAGDHLVVLPAEPMKTAIRFDGRNVANNIVCIGGTVLPEAVYNPSTMRLLTDVDWALWARVGFTGATGGTFRVKCQDATGFIYTAAIAWDADTATIKAAINTALGDANACFIVDGPDTPGGPWKIVPGNNDILGKPSLDIALLTGTPALVTRTTNYSAGVIGLIVQQFLGTVHIEGLYIGGPGAYDAINCSSIHEDCSLQISSCHFNAQQKTFHNDWIHADGAQFFAGPCKFYTERSDYVTVGGSPFIGQPRHIASKPETLWDWWFSDCFFKQRNTFGSVTADAGICVYQQDEWPTPSQSQQSGWLYQMENCYANVYDHLTDEDLGAYFTDGKYYTYFPSSTHTGLTQRQAPVAGYFADPAQGKSGIGYVSPGYTSEGLPTVIKRLEGETKLT